MLSPPPRRCVLGEKQGDNEADTDGEGGSVALAGRGLAPAKVATALQYLAKRAGEAEKGSEEAAKFRGASCKAED